MKKLWFSRKYIHVFQVSEVVKNFLRVQFHIKGITQTQIRFETIVMIYRCFRASTNNATQFNLL